MQDFFDETRQEKIDQLSLQMLKTACSREALVELSGHGFHFTSPISKNTWSAATSWLDDVIFGADRIRFHSHNLKIAYDQFTVAAQLLSREVGRAYSGGDNGSMVVNYTDLSGAQKTKLSENLRRIAKDVLTAFDNLELIAKRA